MMIAADLLNEAVSEHDFGSTEDHMLFCAGTLRGLMDELRGRSDALEAEVADDRWPLPKYREMFFVR